MMKIAVYRRVCTDSQDTVAQDHAIKEWLARHMPTAEVTTFEDAGISGKTEARPGFQALCEAVKRGEVQAVVVYRLDRLSRNAVAAMKLLIEWIQGGVEFFAVDQPILQLGASNPFRLTFCSLMAEVAQLEREAIVARVKSGLKAAKARGVKLGKRSSIPQEKAELIRLRRKAGYSYRDIAREFGITPGAAHYVVNSQS
jgi:DNA invertase Pin-like site-specific DNA recombinase